jgi:hypothetical protein
MGRHDGIGEQRQKDEPGLLDGIRNRSRECPPCNEPIADGAIDAEIERTGKVQAGDAEKQIKCDQRLDTRKHQQRGASADHGHP